MAKKIRLSEKTKADIKRRFEKINPDKLGKNARAYFNKIKAGKTRAKQAFRDGGTYTALPTGFIDKNIKPILKAKGIEPTKEAVKQYLKDGDNLKEAKDFFLTEETRWKYGVSDFPKALQRGALDTKVYIDDGNGLIEVSPNEAQLLMKQYEQKVIELGGFGFKTSVTFKEGFKKMVVYLPDMDGIENLDELIADTEESEIYFIVSSKKSAKKNEAKKGKKPKNKK